MKTSTRIELNNSCCVDVFACEKMLVIDWIQYDSGCVSLTASFLQIFYQ